MVLNGDCMVLPTHGNGRNLKKNDFAVIMGNWRCLEFPALTETLGLFPSNFHRFIFLSPGTPLGQGSAQHEIGKDLIYNH